MFGVIQWMPAYLIRQFGLGVAEVGFYFGVALGLGAAGGAIVGGLVANYLVKRNFMWLVWLPLISAVSVFPLYELAIFAPSATVSLGLIMAVNILGGVSFGPLLTATQTVVLPNMRASASAFVGFTSSVIGVGGGPLLVGILSDYFAPTYGSAVGLQYALAIAVAVTLWGVVHYFLLIKAYPNDRLALDTGS